MFNLTMVEQIVEYGLTSFAIPFHERGLKTLSLYVAELVRWNERMNLTGLKGVEDVVRDLLYDAFFLHGHVKGNETIVDIGSGAGVLAIPLAILNEKMRIFSVDKTLKKIQFQRHIKRTLKISNLYPVHGRIESLEPLNVHGLVAKAFGSMTDILARGGGHIISGGHALLPRGKNQEPEDIDGFTLEGVIPYTLPDSTKSRTLFVYRKHGK